MLKPGIMHRLTSIITVLGNRISEIPPSPKGSMETFNTCWTQWSLIGTKNRILHITSNLSDLMHVLRFFLCSEDCGLTAATPTVGLIFQQNVNPSLRHLEHFKSFARPLWVSNIQKTTSAMTMTKEKLNMHSDRHQHFVRPVYSDWWRLGWAETSVCSQ